MKFTVVFLMCLVIISTVFAQDGLNSSAAAERAARLDALRQLGEMIQGVRISSSTTVRDFVTENDSIRAEFQGLVQGATQVGTAKYPGDGTCEVTMEITMDQIVYWMRTMTYKYKHDDPRQYDQMPTYNNYQTSYRAVGSGAMGSAPTPDYNSNPNYNYPTPDTGYTPPTPSYPQSDIWERISGQGKLMARRGAIVSAYRNLAEMIQGVRIDSKTVVKDFVTESDQITAAFNGYIRGAQIVGDPRYLPDGTVEVTAQVNLNETINTLQDMSRQYHASIPPNKIEGMRQYWPNPVIQATGSAAVDQKYIRKAPAPVVNPYKPYVPPQPPQPVKPYVPEWADRTVKVTGTGARPENAISDGQARLMAQRAAIVDAYRLLAEQVYGLRLQSNTTVEDFVTSKDEIKTRVEGIIRGAELTQPRYNYADETAEVDVTLWLGHIWQALEASYRRQNQGEY